MVILILQIKIYCSIYLRVGGQVVVDINIRIAKAQNDAKEMEQMLTDYLPFIKKQLVGMKGFELEYDDMLSLAMLTFVNCIRQYTSTKGNFFSFCATCIRNRLIDECRKQTAYSSKIVPLFPQTEEITANTPDTIISLEAYDKEQERLSLCQEIDDFSQLLNQYGIKFQDLPRICPKQERSRRQCLELAKTVVANLSLKETLFHQKRLAQAELASIFSISLKTIEKHRKYIVTLALLLSGDYPGIKSFLPQYREVN